MKILLISDLPPCSNHTAGLLIDSLCDYILSQGHELSAFIVKADTVRVEIPQDKLERITFDITRKPREDCGKTSFKGLGSLAGDFSANVKHIPKIKRKITAFAKERNIDAIWGVVQGQTMTKLIRPIAKRCGVPYIVQVFDPINWWFQSQRVDSFTSSYVMKEYKRMLSQATCFLGASPYMAEDYLKEFGCREAVSIMMPFDYSGEMIHDWENTNPALKKRDTFIIVLSGQLYARSTIAVLLKALAEMNWEYKGKRIIFRIYGANIFFDKSGPVYIEYRGWIPQKQLLEELEEADLLYCPYRFDDKFEETARYSFPGKLSTYMNTSTPLLVHSPAYSSISRFIKKYESGYVLESVEKDDIIEMLKRIIDDGGNLDMVRKANQTAKEHLSSDAMHKNFEYALNTLGMKDHKGSRE